MQKKGNEQKIYIDVFFICLFVFVFLILISTCFNFKGLEYKNILLKLF